MPPLRIKKKSGRGRKDVYFKGIFHPSPMPGKWLLAIAPKRHLPGTDSPKKFIFQERKPLIETFTTSRSYLEARSRSGESSIQLWDNAFAKLPLLDRGSSAMKLSHAVSNPRISE
jgi:hypothetical protein